MNCTVLALAAASPSPHPWILALLAAIALLLAALLGRLLAGSRRQQHDAASATLQRLDEELRALRGDVQQTLLGGQQTMDRRLAETNRLVGEVQRGLGQVDRQVLAVRDTTRDLQRLQELLRSPKLRGGMGEHLLAELLAQVLPQAHFDLQFGFADNVRVDAVLRIGDRLVPVDAKFPLESFHGIRQAESDGEAERAQRARKSFRRELRRHVDAIASRYIRPGEGTYDFAMMYVPAEAVYQEMIRSADANDDDTLHYAMTRRVVPVSPQSFYAYLQVIVFGLKGLHLEQRTREWLAGIGEVERQFELLGQALETLGRHLSNAQRQADEARRRTDKVRSGIDRLSEHETTEVAVTDRIPSAS